MKGVMVGPAEARAAPALARPAIRPSSRLPSSSDSCVFLNRFLKLFLLSLALGEEWEGERESSEFSERRSPSSCRNLGPG